MVASAARSWRVTTSVRLDFVAAAIALRLVPLAMSRRQPSAAIVPPTVASSQASSRSSASSFIALAPGTWSCSSRHSPSGPQHEHGDDAHPAGGDDRADEDPESERQAAVTVALQAYQAVADQPAGDAAEEIAANAAALAAGEGSADSGRSGGSLTATDATERTAASPIWSM